MEDSAFQYANVHNKFNTFTNNKELKSCRPFEIERLVLLTLFPCSNTHEIFILCMRGTSQITSRKYECQDSAIWTKRSLPLAEVIIKGTEINRWPSFGKPLLCCKHQPLFLLLVSFEFLACVANLYFCPGRHRKLSTSLGNLDQIEPKFHSGEPSFFSSLKPRFE